MLPLVAPAALPAELTPAGGIGRAFEIELDVNPGDWVVQNGGNSGVGRSLIAIARLRGIRTISLVRRRELIDELKAAGADLVLMDEPAAVEEAARVIGKGSVRFGWRLIQWAVMRRQRSFRCCPTAACSSPTQRQADSRWRSTSFSSLAST